MRMTDSCLRFLQLHSRKPSNKLNVFHVFVYSIYNPKVSASSFFRAFAVSTVCLRWSFRDCLIIRLWVECEINAVSWCVP